MPSKLVERRLNDFQYRCGKDGDTALELACYAAIPVALNPELLHFLRINFFFEPPKQLPYTVEFEFFTSGLCREIDVELYEIEPEIRNELLKKLKNTPQRIRDVATLLWQYVEYHSPWEDRVELKRAQQLTALHFLNPEKAQEWLDKAKADNSHNGGGQEWFIAMRQEIDQLPPLLSNNQRFSTPPTPQHLTPQHLRKLRDALISAFPAKSSLDQLLYFGLGKNLNQITSDSNLQTVVFQLIQTAESQGWLIELVKAARKENPGNSELKVIAVELLPPETSDDLSSNRSIDYSQLRNLLAAQQWKEADEETLAIMLKASGRETEGWLDASSIENFPYTDLHTIDQLWVEFSNGHFGFSVQQKIYLEVGGIADGKYYSEAWHKFRERVGWTVNNTGIDYSEVKFSTNAPVGHLPAKCCRKMPKGERHSWSNRVVNRVVFRLVTSSRSQFEQ